MIRAADSPLMCIVSINTRLVVATVLPCRFRQLEPVLRTAERET